MDTLSVPGQNNKKKPFLKPIVIKPNKTGFIARVWTNSVRNLDEVKDVVVLNVDNMLVTSTLDNTTEKVLSILCFDSCGRIR